MGVFEQFPYSNFHDLNLDWILKKITEFSEQLDLNKDDMIELRRDVIQFENRVEHEINEFSSQMYTNVEQIINELGVTPLPVVSIADDGDVLGVSNGIWTKLPTVPGDLPIVTSGDAGRALMVNSNGLWSAGIDVEAGAAADQITQDAVFNFSLKSPSSNATNRRINADGTYSTDNTMLTKKYAVTAGTSYRVRSDIRFQFQTDNSTVPEDPTRRVGKTYGIGTFIVTAPETATYLMVCTYKDASVTIAAAYDISSKITTLAASVDDDIASVDTMPARLNKLILDGGIRSTMPAQIAPVEYYVGPDGDYQTISAAITAWESDLKPIANIYVANGEYNEKIAVGRNANRLSIIGESREGTIIRTKTGTYADAPVLIYHGNVFFSNMTVIADWSAASQPSGSGTYGYAIHIDDGTPSSAVAGTVHVKNVTAVSYQAPAFGMGTIPGSTIIIEDSDAFCYTPSGATTEYNNGGLLCHLAAPSLYPSTEPEALKLINVRVFSTSRPVMLKDSGSTKKMALTAIRTTLYRETDSPSGTVGGLGTAELDSLSTGNSNPYLNYSE